LAITVTLEVHMADLPSHPDSDDADAGHGRGRAGGTPRWVGVLGAIVAIVVILLVIVLHLAGVLGPGAH
jgi:hypothetical protein